MYNISFASSGSVNFRSNDTGPGDATSTFPSNTAFVGDHFSVDTSTDPHFVHINSDGLYYVHSFFSLSLFPINLPVFSMQIIPSSGPPSQPWNNSDGGTSALAVLQDNGGNAYMERNYMVAADTGAAWKVGMQVIHTASGVSSYISAGAGVTIYRLGSLFS
jgi:hypothetical protein